VASLRLLVFFHLLWTAVLAGLSLLLSIRFPYRETAGLFRLTLALLAVTGLAVIPLLFRRTDLFWLAPITFAVATIAFTVFAIQVLRTHVRRMRDRHS
jgi:hypothetical protein